MRIYRENGYLNVDEIAAHPSWLKVIIGARQIGKTYNTLKYYLDEGSSFILLRRTTQELDMIQGEQINPFKAFEPEYHTAIFRKGKLLAICDYDDKGAGRERGLVLSLPQIAHIRGFNGSMYESIIFDEFIPEKGVRTLKTEGDALLNAYTTINGNRELEGRPPCTMWLLANSNSINSPILEALNLIDPVIQMRVKGLEWMETGGALIIQPKSTGIVDKRKDTALMKQISDKGEFYGMAINNEFSYDRSPLISSQSLKKYKPLFSYDNSLFAWESPEQIYVCRAKHKAAGYDNSNFDRERLRNDFFWIKRAYAESLVFFSDLRMLALFKWLFDIDY